MVTTHNLGFPRIGAQRELKFAQESYWKGQSSREALQAEGLTRPLLQLGLRDEFIEHGDHAKLLSLQGLDAVGIEAAIRARFGAAIVPAEPGPAGRPPAN